MNRGIGAWRLAIGALGAMALSSAALPCDGACCLPDGTCVYVLHDECMDLGGIFTEGVLCEDVTCIIELSLDIKPTSCPNPFNPKAGGYLPVAVLGSEMYDVMMLDVATIKLTRADKIVGSVTPNFGPPGPSYSYEDVAGPYMGEEPCGCTWDGWDGYMDLSLKFDRRLMTEVLELAGLPGGTEIPLVLTGYTMDGTPFMATDCIVIPPVGMPMIPMRSAFD